MFDQLKERIVLSLRALPQNFLLINSFPPAPFFFSQKPNLILSVLASYFIVLPLRLEETAGPHHFACSPLAFLIVMWWSEAVPMNLKRHCGPLDTRLNTWNCGIQMRGFITPSCPHSPCILLERKRYLKYARQTQSPIVQLWTLWL